MPNQPKTPNRVVRVDDASWGAAQKMAAENGETVADVIRRALRDYTTTQYPRDGANRPGA